MLALGTVIGLLNAGLVIVLRIHPLIVTLGMSAILQGTTLFYAMGPIGKVPRNFNFLAYGRIAGLPVGATIAVVLCILIALFLRYLPLGRQIYAVGDDDDAARLAGLRRSQVLLTRSRDHLLPRLISGDLSVAMAEHELEQAA